MRSGAVAVAALCLVQFVDVLGVTVVVTALPVMLADLGAPPSSGSLVVTAYAMFFGGLLMLGARPPCGPAVGPPPACFSRPPCSGGAHAWVTGSVTGVPSPRALRCSPRPRCWAGWPARSWCWRLPGACREPRPLRRYQIRRAS